MRTVPTARGPTGCSRPVRVLLGGAATAGVVHAAFSAYWALGGDWLLATVGAWAVDYVSREPAISAVLLLTVAAVKSLVALGPVLLCRHRLQRHRRWHRLLVVGAWTSAAVLTVYGAANSVAAWLVLGGAVDTTAPIERDAMIGHGFLWDPLFLAWGLLLGAGLYARTHETHRPASGPSHTTW